MYGSTMKKKLYVESRTWDVWKKRLHFQNIYKCTHSLTHVYKSLYVSKNFAIDFNRNFSNKICFIFSFFFLLRTDSFLTVLCDIFSCLCLSPSHRMYFIWPILFLICLALSSKVSRDRVNVNIACKNGSLIE